MRKKIALLGASGSIGRATIDVLSNMRDDFELALASVHTNLGFAKTIFERFSECKKIIVTGNVTDSLDDRFLIGGERLVDLLIAYKVDLVVFAIPSGSMVSLFLRIVEAGIPLAMANKECLVMAKDIISPAIEKNILPIDSEQSALWQLLPKDLDIIDKVIITCSGGPFFGKKRDDLVSILPESAIAHPRWNMGKKISLDSATLMNKALEVIEAVSLFGLDFRKIDVVVHPQAVIHGGVSLVDGAVFLHAGMPDMKLPIQYALTYPYRRNLCDVGLRLNLAEMGKLEFFCPDEETFPSIRLAYKALEMGGSALVVFNVANDMLGQMFLEGRIGFLQIVDTIGRILEEHNPWEIRDISSIEEAVKWTRAWIENFHS